jgi:hypothetical protein
MKFLAMLVGFAVAAWASAADASVSLRLSDYTPETRVPASWLDALMTFTVSGNTLTLRSARHTRSVSTISTLTFPTT